MSNKSYCRFQNTAPDLKDCLENMDDNYLSQDEAIARRRLIQVAVAIAEEYGHEVKDLGLKST